MAYSNEVVAKARQRLAQMKADRESMQWHRLNQAYNQVPRIREIDAQLRRNMTLAAQAAFSKGAENAMQQVMETAMTLQAEREDLVKANFPPNYLDESPICEKCGGAGYIGSTMCSCLTEICRQEQTKALSLLTCGEGRFEDFRLDYYPDQFDPNLGTSPRALMEINLNRCKRYVEQFGSENLMFVGGTGLGKTYLSACIARALAEKGYSVAYEPAGQLFSKLEKNRFTPTEETQQQCNQLASSDLLIIDDLGTELPGNFVNAAFYNLLNDRLLAGKPMIISTNLLASEIAQRYTPQIASRLQGNFRQLPFVGKDIRLLKNGL